MKCYMTNEWDTTNVDLGHLSPNNGNQSPCWHRSLKTAASHISVSKTDVELYWHFCMLIKFLICQGCGFGGHLFLLHAWPRDRTVGLGFLVERELSVWLEIFLPMIIALLSAQIQIHENIKQIQNNSDCYGILCIFTFYLQDSSQVSPTVHKKWEEKNVFFNSSHALDC